MQIIQKHDRQEIICTHCISFDNELWPSRLCFCLSLFVVLLFRLRRNLFSLLNVAEMSCIFAVD